MHRRVVFCGGARVFPGVVLDAIVAIPRVRRAYGIWHVHAYLFGARDAYHALVR